MFREVALVALKEVVRRAFDEVDFSFDAERRSGGEAAEAEVGVEAADDALEEFLPWFPCGGEDGFSVGAEGTDESAVRDGGVEGARVDIRGWGGWGTPDLSGGVACGGGPVAGGHAREFAIEEEEALRQVVGGIGRRLRWEAAESAEADAGLSPVGFRALPAGVFCFESEGNLVRACGDGVGDGEALAEGVAQADFRAAGIAREEFLMVGNDGMLDPVGVRGIGAAVGFRVIDVDGSTGDRGSLEGKDMAVVMEGDGRGVGGMGAGEPRQQWNEEGKMLHGGILVAGSGGRQSPWVWVAGLAWGLGCGHGES